MTGQLARRFGPLNNIPLAGDVPCGLTLMSGTGISPPVTRGHPFGCIPGAAQFTTTGIGKGGPLALPANAFAQPLPTTPRVFSIPSAMLQITTSLAVAQPSIAQLRANAWSTQAGRLGPDFTWCVGNPACTNAIQGTGQFEHLFVKYTAGPNRFGGTIGFVISAGANPTRFAIKGGIGNPNGVTFVPIGTTGARPTGRGYAAKKTDPSVPGSAWAMYMASAMGRITMATTYLGPRPLLGSRMAHGFPFTTGTVVVRRTGMTPGPAKSPATLTLTAVGGDSVTTMGARNITLVAGSLVNYSNLSADVGLNQIALPEPSALLQWWAGAIALFAIAAVRARSAKRVTRAPAAPR